MLETAERINLNKLTLQSPKPESSTFDPDQYISDDLWQRLGEYYTKTFYDETNYGDFLDGLQAMSILSPKKLNQVYNLDNLPKAATRLFKAEINLNAIHPTRHPAQLKIIVPHLVKPKNTDQIQIEIEQNFKLIANFGPEELSNLFILFPHLKTNFKLPSDLKGLVDDMISRTRRYSNLIGQGKSTLCAKILGFSNQAIGITDEEKEKYLTKYLEAKRSANWGYPFSAIAALKCLHAIEIIPTDNGLEFTMHTPNFNQTTPQLPERRKF